MLSQDEDLLEVRKRERREQKNNQPTNLELDKKVSRKHYFQKGNFSIFIFQEARDCPDSRKSLWCNLQRLKGAIDKTGYFIRAY